MYTKNRADYKIPSLLYAKSTEDITSPLSEDVEVSAMAYDVTEILISSDMSVNTKDMPKLKAQMEEQVVTVLKDNEENPSDARNIVSSSLITRRQIPDDVAEYT